MATEAAKTDPHAVTIYVNATPVEFDAEVMTYEHVVNIAFDNNPPTGPDVSITVTYSNGVDGAEGSLRPTEKVDVAAGMVFNVKATNKS
jgi:Multiubiquitin